MPSGARAHECIAPDVHRRREGPFGSAGTNPPEYIENARVGAKAIFAFDVAIEPSLTLIFGPAATASDAAFLDDGPGFRPAPVAEIGVQPDPRHHANHPRRRCLSLTAFKPDDQKNNHRDHQDGDVKVRKCCCNGPTLLIRPPGGRSERAGSGRIKSLP